ncbi:MAG: sugar ABC transporter permease [Chloroflexota bacterium]
MQAQAVLREQGGRSARPESRSAREAREKRLGLALLLPSVLIPLLLMLSFVFGIAMTFTQWRLTNGFARVNGLDNYIELLTRRDFWHAFAMTLKFTAIDVPVEVLLGLGLALLLNERLRGLRFWRTLLILPLMTPPVVGSLLWKVIMRPTGAGILNYMLMSIGFPMQGFLGDPNQALPSLVAIDVWLYTPFVATILLAGLQSLPREPYEAALVDGASAWQAFRHITLPLLVPYFIVVGFFRAIDSLNVFDTIYGTTGGGPGDASRVLNMMALEEGFNWYNLSIGITVTVFLWAVCMVVGYTLFRHVQRERQGGTA